ncbi:MAG: Hsp20/alpha crystallin family protein [bacterium]|nr:Hsp20/alpha crystallin family protein [bacterium]
MRTVRRVVSRAAVAAALAGGQCLAMAQPAPPPAAGPRAEEPAVRPRMEDRWGLFHSDPWWEELREMRERMDRVMADAYGRFGPGIWAPHRPPGFHPEIDVRETETAIVVSCDLPGMEKDKIEVAFRDGNLVIGGERESVVERAGDAGWYVAERSFGRFERIIPVGAEVKEDEISADYRDGVLTVTLPKAEPAARPGRKIRIL